MAEICSKCNLSCILKEPLKGGERLFGCICDRCKTITCRSCEKWSATEIRFLALQSRKIPYFCQECAQKINPDSEQIERIYNENRRFSEIILEMEEKAAQSGSDLKLRIKSLTTEMEERDKHINELRRQSLDFQDEVFLTENDLQLEIEKLKKTVSAQNFNIKKLSAHNTQLKKDKDELLNTINRQKSDQLTILETRQSENNKLQQELEKYKSQITELESQIEKNNESWAVSDRDHKNLLHENHSEIENLKAKIYTSEIIIKEYSQSTLIKNQTITKSKLELEEIKEEYTNMLGALRFYEEESTSFQKQLCELRKKLAHLEKVEICNSQSKERKTFSKNEVSDKQRQFNIKTNFATINDNNSKNNDTYASQRSLRQRNRILLLTDEYGKYLFPHLDKLFSADYSVQVVCKTNAMFKDVINGQQKWISEFTNNDYVIVLAGLNNNDIALKDITLLSNMCFYTNLVLCTIPAKYDASIPYKSIEIVNKKIINVVTNLRLYSTNINYLDLYGKFRYCDYSRGVFLNNRGLAKMACFVRNAVINFKSSSFTCLKKIEAQPLLACVSGNLNIECMPERTQELSISEDFLSSNYTDSSSDLAIINNISGVQPLDSALESNKQLNVPLEQSQTSNIINVEVLSNNSTNSGHISDASTDFLVQSLPQVGRSSQKT